MTDDLAGVESISLAVKLLTRKSSPEGEVHDVRFEADGVSLMVELSLADDPLLALGERVMLVFPRSSLAGQLTASGRVIFARRDESSCSYQFQCGLEARTVLTPAINRREAFRVCTNPNAPIDVILGEAAGGARMEALLHDISVTGLSVLVPEENESDLHTLWRLGFSFKLPVVDEVLDFTGTVRYRRLMGSVVFYGIKFNEETTPDFARKQRIIEAYIAERQSETLLDSQEKLQLRR